jgi:hypothetical protein
MSGLPMMACSDRRPILPVVHWITRNGWPVVVALIWGSSAGVIELIMFNPPTRAGAGRLLRRVNFAVPDNFPAVYRRHPPTEPTARAGWVMPTRSEQPVFDTCQYRLDVVLCIEQALNFGQIASAATDRRAASELRSTVSDCSLDFAQHIDKPPLLTLL